MPSQLLGLRLFVVLLAGGVIANAAEHWAFKPVTPREPPEVNQVGWVQSDVDRFVLGRFESRSAAPTPAADRRMLIRRATYDLIGLPPTPEEVDAFLADSSPNAFAKVIERLLASPHYGEQWGRKWLDVVRYADTAGENSDHPLPHAWRYRNWVINAFNQDKSYAEFIREQIAGDLLAASGTAEEYADRVIATGYLAIARRFGHDIDKDIHLTLEDTIDTLGKSVLGLTLGCARCHDHKNDPVSTRDYYGLYGIFESTRFAFPGCEPQQQPRDLVPLWSAAELADRRKPFEEKLAKLDASIQELKDRQAKLAAALDTQLTNAVHPLAAGEIDDGGAQSFGGEDKLLSLTVKAGEMIRLTVFPRANHGADTTVLELRLTEADGERRSWDITEDLVGDFHAGNPHADGHGNHAVWSLLDARKGFQLLSESVRDHDGKAGLHVWRNGDTPSAVVNSTDQPIKVWTALPARTLFVHPAADGPVAVAWVSPIAGTIQLKGRVADGHPGGGDGVAWKLEHVAGDFGSGVTQLAVIANELREPLAKRSELMSQEPRVPVGYAVVDGEVKDAKLQKRGDPEQPGEVVPRKFLDVLGGQLVSSTNESGRLEFAGWLTDPGNPLTARVMVNRIWQGHFGAGLVPTPNDFGRQGQPPTDPALLDWLADQFVRSGWSVKAMHRLLMTSAAYQRSSVTEGSLQRPQSAFARRRLTAEELRDTLLAVSGELDRAPGEAHPFPPQEKWSFTQHGPFAAEYDTLKRSVYVMQKRNRRIPFFALFDGPDPNASTAKRDVTTVPTQALYFMNDPFVHARSRMFADRILAAGEDDSARLDFALRQLFGRVANADEQAEAAEFLKSYAEACTDQPAGKRTQLAWAAYARVLFSSNELLYVD